MLGVELRICNPSFKEAERESFELQTSLSYIVDPILKKELNIRLVLSFPSSPPVLFHAGD
jgi:hypothetical protein